MSDLSKWTPSDMLEPVRRFLDGDLSIAPGIKIEQFQEGSTLVVRAEVPGIDPDQDVDVSVSGGMLHIRWSGRKRPSTRAKPDTARSSATALRPQHRAAAGGEGRRYHRHLQGRRPGGPGAGSRDCQGRDAKKIRIDRS